MKLNLLCDNNLQRGYINVAPVDIPNSDGYELRLSDPRDLDEIAEDGSVDEIVANDLVLRFHPNEIADIVRKWVQKLKVGGKLILTFFDFRLIAQEIYINNIDIGNAHVLLYGQQNEKQGLFDYETAKLLFDKLGMHTNHISVRDMKVYIEGVK